VSVAEEAPSVSQPFAKKHRRQETVVNSYGAEVGRLAGDGSVLIPLAHFDRLRHFEICLLAQASELSSSNEGAEKPYTVRDIGISSAEYDLVNPMYIPVRRLEVVEDAEYSCFEVTSELLLGQTFFDTTDGVIRLFPILRLESAENVQSSIYSESSIALMKALLACYCAALVFAFIFVVVVFREVAKGSVSRPMPVIGWIGVMLVCMAVFRIAYLSLLYQGKLEGEYTTEYILFELPTFCYLTIVLLVLGLFLAPMQMNTQGTRKRLEKTWIYCIIGILLVWLLWATVAIVYTQVILEVSEVYSPCPGRAPASYAELQDNTRTLSLVYQCTVYFISLFAAVLVIITSRRLVKKTGDGKGSRFVFEISVITLLPYLIRCVLLLVALFARIESAAYMFTTLLATEVFMIVCLSTYLTNLFLSAIYGSIRRMIHLSKMSNNSTGSSQRYSKDNLNSTSAMKTVSSSQSSSN
tara:strand:+ start:889 stop:2292 length:1404 start_codon:yes stop_codon:yes gene_type:complete